MPKDTAFNGETTPRQPPGDPKTLCAKHEYPISGKSFIPGDWNSELFLKLF